VNIQIRFDTPNSAKRTRIARHFSWPSWSNWRDFYSDCRHMLCFLWKRSTSRNCRGMYPRSRNPVDNVLNVRYSAIHKDTIFVGVCHDFAHGNKNNTSLSYDSNVERHWKSNFWIERNRYFLWSHWSSFILF